MHVYLGCVQLLACSLYKVVDFNFPVVVQGGWWVALALVLTLQAKVIVTVLHSSTVLICLGESNTENESFDSWRANDPN